MEYKGNRHIKKIFDCYVYRQKGAHGTYEFLILKRASEKIYAGQWRMIGGKVISGETYWQAALREMKEEIGISKLNEFWTVPDMNTFYDPQNDAIRVAPVFAAEIDDQQSIQLDGEHNTYQWISAERAEKWLDWPQQSRLIQLIDRLLERGLVPEWKINYDQKRK